jgi:hypothetical protein
VSVVEKLRVPVAWWALAAVGVLALFLAYDAALGMVPALLTAALLSLACGVWLASQSATTVAATPTGLRAGAAHLPPDAIGTVEVLDAASTAAARGPLADPHAFFVLKGYVRTSVRVWVDDPHDPVPYWLVSTRKPIAVADALALSRDQAHTGT